MSVLKCDICGKPCNTWGKSFFGHGNIAMHFDCTTSEFRQEFADKYYKGSICYCPVTGG